MHSEGGGIRMSECKRVGEGSQLGRYERQWAHVNEWARARTEGRGITGATMAGAAITTAGAAALATAAIAVAGLAGVAAPPAAAATAAAPPFSHPLFYFILFYFISLLRGYEQHMLSCSISPSL